MKKRLLSALLALALVFVLLPTTALAEETTYSDSEITISGKYWNFGNKGTSGEYAPVYFRSNGTAFEESEPTGSNYLEIRKTSANEITIKVHGTVDLTEDKNSTNSCISVNSAGMNKRNLIITGAAKGSTLNLTCKNYSHPLYSYEGSITINGGVTVNATSQYSNNNNNVSVYGIQVSNGHDLTISGTNTKVNVVNKTYDSTVKVNGNITVSDGAQLKAENKSGKVTGYTSKKAYAIECGQLSISGDKTQVTAYTGQGKKAINGTVNNGTANDDYKLTFKAGMYEGAPSFNYPKPMDEALEYAYVEITQAPTNPYVRIAGEPAIIGQETPIPGGTGTYRYDVGTGYNGDTLTLNNVTINKTSNNAAKAIQFDKNNGTYTVNLVGANTISNVSYGISTNSAYSEATSMSVTITGSGSLDISAKAYAIEVPKGDLTFNGTGNITLTTNHNYVNPRNALYVAGSVTIDTTKYDITGEKPVVNPTTENLNGNPNLDTILKGTSTNTDLYFKTITITPAAAKDSTIRYNGTTLKQGETIKDGKGGTATVDSKNNTITLDNFKGNYPLEFNAEFTPNFITLIGDSTLSAVETKYQDLTISGSGSLTVGSIKVHNQKTSSDDKPNLTINGATVTVGTAELTTRAIDIDGDLTVTNGSLTATSTSDSVPTVQVGGNASFTGSTVTITNNSTTQGKQYEDSNAASSALHVNGAVTISGGTVTAEAKAGGNAIRAVGNITVSNDATVTAKNNSQYFNAITAGSATGGEVNTLYNLIVSGENTRITATNTYVNSLTYGGAINAYIENANEGHYLKANTDSKAIAPNDSTTVKSNDLTITRGDEVTPVVIAGTPLLNDTYYTITNGSTVVANGSKDNYNAFYESATKTLKLNNAQISHSFAYEDGGGKDGAIIFTKFENYFIELSGENTISSTNTYAINCHRPDRTLTIKNAAEAENAKLTLTSNWMVICSIGGLNIQSDVTMVNTKEAGYLMYVNDTFSFDGYNAYASVNASGSPLVEYTVPTSGDKDAGYQYLRITKETLETGGGSTHQHTYDQSAWKSDATHHWQECTDPNCPDPTKGITNKASHIFSNGACTVCGYRGQTEEHHFSTDWTYDETHHWHACTDDGCTAISGKAPHEWTGWRIDEPSPGMHNRFCNCGYNDYSHHYNLVYAAAGEAGHYQYCTLGNCTFKTSTVPHNYDGDTCTICNYTKSGEIVPPTPDNPGTIVIIRPAEEEKPAQQPNPSTGANDLVGLAVAAAVAAALGSAALLRKHD